MQAAGGSPSRGLQDALQLPAGGTGCAGLVQAGRGGGAHVAGHVLPRVRAGAYRAKRQPSARLQAALLQRQRAVQGVLLQQRAVRALPGRLLALRRQPRLVWGGGLHGLGVW